MGKWLFFLLIGTKGNSFFNLFKLRWRQSELLCRKYKGLADSCRCTWVLRSVYEKAFPSIMITLENYAEESVQVLLFIKTRCLGKCCRDFKKKKKKVSRRGEGQEWIEKEKDVDLPRLQWRFKGHWIETGCKRNGNTWFVDSGNTICANRNRHQKNSGICVCVPQGNFSWREERRGALGTFCDVFMVLRSSIGYC